MIRKTLSRLLFWVLKNKQFSSHEVACLAISALRNSKMSLEDRSLCTSALLDGLYALPLRSIITFSEQGNLFVNGNLVDPEKAHELRESARAVLHSPARLLVKEQVTYAAVEIGVHKAFNHEHTIFLKAALWYLKEEEDLYKAIARSES